MTISMTRLMESIAMKTMTTRTIAMMSMIVKTLTLMKMMMMKNHGERIIPRGKFIAAIPRHRCGNSASPTGKGRAKS